MRQWRRAHCNVLNVLLFGDGTRARCATTTPWHDARMSMARAASITRRSRRSIAAGHWLFFRWMAGGQHTSTC
jgi:hypothetical protein